MKSKSPFLSSIVEEASKCEVQMPWTRGARRAALIARRKAEPELRKVKTA